MTDKPDINQYERDVLLEVASTFKNWEQDALLATLAEEDDVAGTLKRARKVVYKKAVMSLIDKGLLKFWKEDRGPLDILLSQNRNLREYAALTDQGRVLAEELAEDLA